MFMCYKAQFSTAKCPVVKNIPAIFLQKIGEYLFKGVFFISSESADNGKIKMAAIILDEACC